jgi:hypothetical protein
MAGAAVLRIGGISCTSGSNSGYMLGIDMGGVECAIEIERCALVSRGISVMAGTAGGRIRSLGILGMAVKTALVPGFHELGLAFGAADDREGLHPLGIFFTKSSMAHCAVSAFLFQFSHMSFVIEGHGRHLGFVRVLHDNTHDPGIADRDLDCICGVTERNDACKASHHRHSASKRVSLFVHGESFQ